MLRPAEIERLTTLFQSLGWPITQDNGDSPLFQSFTRLFSALDDEQRELMFRVTADFFAHSYGLYGKSANSLVASLASGHIPADSMVILLPLVKPSDIGKVKSSVMALYPMKDELLAVASTYNWSIKSSDRYDYVKRKHSERRNGVIILADDFIGSGTTATQAVAYFKDNYAVPSDTIIVTAFVAQRAAMTSLAANGITCVTVYEKLKGISDSLRLPDKAAAMVTMDGIGSLLDIAANMRRGFDASEALVMMARCPNNTFPVYWAPKDRRGSDWPSPFRRLS